jgi:hypothetical protein
MILSEPRHEGKSLWDNIRGRIVKARTAEEITKALEESGSPYAPEFAPTLSTLILRSVRAKKFPKGPKAQISFLAESIAARGRVSPSRSRKICQEQRAKETRERAPREPDWFLYMAGFREPKPIRVKPDPEALKLVQARAGATDTTETP